jgi:hypothetical protein
MNREVYQANNSVIFGGKPITEPEKFLTGWLRL